MSRTRFSRVLIFLLLLQGAVATAAEQRMTAAEIAATITGNSIEGEYEGDPYRQYFGPDGTTIFQLEDGRRFEGDWHVDAAQDKYCSYQWYRGTRCYSLFREGRQIFWIEDGSGDRLPSTLIEGRKLYEE